MDSKFFMFANPEINYTIADVENTLGILKYHKQNLFFAPQKKISSERRREGGRESSRVGQQQLSRLWDLLAHCALCTCSSGNITFT